MTLSFRNLSALIVMLGIALSTAPARAGTTRLEYLPEGITAISVSGDSTALALSTAPGHVLQVTAEDWPGCGIRAALAQEGDTFRITVRRSLPHLAFWCDPDVTVVMPEDMALDISLKNLAADLSGKFSDVRISSAEAAVNFDGRAAHFTMQGRRAAVKLNFAADMPRDAVSLEVKSLLSQVTFAGV